MKNIIETAIGNTSFATLVTAVKATDLVTRLTDAGPFTVLAPTNEAFAKLEAGALTALLADKTKLTALLKHHVIAGKLMAKDIQPLKEATTLSGDKVVIDGTNGVMVNKAKVISPDIECSNGVIHAIDTVLMP